MDHPVITDLAKATPPATIIASAMYGVQWSEIAYFLTAIYTFGLICQQGYRLAKWLKERKQISHHAKKFRRPK